MKKEKVRKEEKHKIKKEHKRVRKEERRTSKEQRRHAKRVASKMDAAKMDKMKAVSKWVSDVNTMNCSALESSEKMEDDRQGLPCISFRVV